jgi:hypothetical protein
MELLNFPFKNQLNEPLLDGLPNENAAMDCCPTCIASGMQYLTGKQFTGEELTHSVYGKNYTGGTAAIEFVAYCSEFGVKLSAISSRDAVYLVSQIHAQLALGHPIIGTIPSSYQPPTNPLNPGMSHCIIFYKDAPGALTAMNPWEAFSQQGTDAWWAARLCFAQVWVLQKGSSMNIPSGWRDSGSVLTAPNNKNVVEGFRSWVLAHDWRSDDLPLENEHGAAGGGTEQCFLYERLRWTSTTSVQVQPYGEDYLALQEKISAEPTPVNITQDLQDVLTSVQAILKKVGS